MERGELRRRVMAKGPQAATARRIGVTRSHLNEILQGKTTPSLPVALNLADEAGIPTREIRHLFGM